VAPPGILPVPLLRALLVGDADRARQLGALELVEEDLMLLSYVCPSKTDYGLLLRKVLDQLHKEAI
jgi:Na+-transporting NADH:ubiquinone oxidoreductase subunit A